MLFRSEELQLVKRADDGKRLAKRDLSLRANGTIDSWYGCFLYDELIDYALNFSAPWSACLCFSAHLPCQCLLLLWSGFVCRHYGWI